MTTTAHSQDTWPEVPLGQLLSAIEAGKNLRCEERPPEPFEKGVIKVSSVTWGAFDKTQSKTLPSSYEPSQRSLIRNGDFLISRANTLELVGACVVVEDAPDNLYLSDKVLRLVLPDDLKPWLLRFLRSSIGRARIEAASTGNQLSMRNIGQEAIRSLMVPLPDDSGRRRIVSKIDNLSTKSRRARDHLDHIPRLVEKYKQTILAAAYAGALLQRSSAQWRVSPIRSMIDALDQGWSPRCDNEPASDREDWAVIKTTAIQPIHFNGDENKRLPAALRPRPELVIAPDDVLITRAGPRSRVAIACVVKQTRQRLMLCDKAYRLRVTRSVADPTFLALMLNAPQSLETLEGMKTGISDSGLNLTQAKFLELAVPKFTLPEQQEIVRRAETAFAWIDRLASEASSARKLIDHLDQAVLAKAFRGELVPQDLERVRAARTEPSAASPSVPRRRNAKARS